MLGAAALEAVIGRPAAIAADTVCCVCPAGIGRSADEVVGKVAAGNAAAAEDAIEEGVAAIDAPEKDRPEKDSPDPETPIGATETTVGNVAAVEAVGRPATGTAVEAVGNPANAAAGRPAVEAVGNP
jgi:hypothetical protein